MGRTPRQCLDTFHRGAQELYARCSERRTTRVSEDHYFPVSDSMRLEMARSVRYRTYNVHHVA
jgi:hypothetical protein